MVGMVKARAHENAANLLDSIKFSIDIPLKLDLLRKLKELLLYKDPSLLPDFVTPLLELHTDRLSPIRKSLAEMIGEIGLLYTEFVPEMVPVLENFLKDDTPAVARQAITSGMNLFRTTLEKVAIKGLYSSELDDSIESSWVSMLKFKDMLYQIAFQRGSDGIRLLSVKFVEAIVLLFTPDPNGTSEPPPDQPFEGNIIGFDISWLRGGHSVLNVGDLSTEASQSLGLLLDQLRFPAVKSISNLMIIVLINSLAAIANKRPAFYGRILPVLLGLDPSSSFNGTRITGVHNALKNAFLSCLKCTHPGAAPWCDRLIGALKEMKAGGMAEQAVHPVVRITGSEAGTHESHITEEEKPLMKACDEVHVDSGKKRSIVQEIGDPDHENDVSRKRAKPAPIVSEGSLRDRNPNLSQGSLPGDDSGPVQQLVAMFGALVAQGDKAAGSLEILISSISADLLAEVVMANMRYLPPTGPKVEEDESQKLNLSSLSSISGIKTFAIHLSSLISNVPSLSGLLPQIASPLDSQASALPDITLQKYSPGDEREAVNICETASVLASEDDATASMLSVDVHVPVPAPADGIISPGSGNNNAAIQSDIHDMGTLEGGIPGLHSIVKNDGMAETLDASPMASADLQTVKQEQVIGTDRSFLLDFPSSVSMATDKSEELSSKGAASDINNVASTATSVVVSSQYILPKMSAPVISLTDEQKDHLQKSVFIRIIEAYKQIAIAGGSNLRFSLLSCLAVEYPLELDPWELLQKHILSDYVNYEGHELTLRVLYRLFGEAEQENDFFSSTTATSVYETFLLTVAGTLRDSFPASDKSLSRLLSEAPYLPKTAFKLLESLCSPGSNENIDKELQSGDRVTQGLSAVWNLILQRPPIRDVCLKIALQSAVHQLEEVRMKAIRLVANKLYRIPCIAQQIENFASEMLLSVMKGHATEQMDTEGSTAEVQKDSDLENEQPLASTVTKETSSDTHQSHSTSSTSTALISDAQRCMSLYFALCTKKHSLFRQIFVVYQSIPQAVTQAVHRHIPILVRTMGSSSELLAIISDPPTGSENLLMQVLHILTDGTIPSRELIFTVRRLYDKLKDVKILIPILSSLPKDEVLPIFPKLVNLPLDKFQAALARMLQGSSPSGPVLSPAEVLIAIHGIDPEKDAIPLKKVMDACNACFEQRQVFTQQVLAKVLNQLVEQIPLPLLFMRTVLQAIGAFPALVDFIMEILSRLVTKQIWKYPKLWVGFLKCALLTKPQSFGVLLQLPAAQLENALNRTAAALKAPLIAHADQPSIRSSLPRSTLVVLGLATDTQVSSQAPKSPTQTTETSNSGTEGRAEKTKESSTAS